MTTAASPARCPGVGQPVAIRQFVAQPCPACGKRLEPLLSFKVRRHEPPKRKEETPDMATPTITLNAETAADTLRAILDHVRNKRRILVSGGDAGAVYPAPSEDAFDKDGIELAFLKAGDIARIAAELIDANPARFGHLNERKIEYLWKAKGGTKDYKPNLGAASKPSGLLRHFSDADFILWLAADHIRAQRLTAWQVEALIHHELLHCGYDEKGNPAMSPHDFVGFLAELDTYGPWQRELQDAARAFQMALELE